MLDGGPARVVRPTDRQQAYRQEAVRVPQESPVSIRPPVEPVEPQVKASRKERSGTSRGVIVGLVLALVVALSFAGFMAFQNYASGVGGSIDKDKYQAVFFANGQVYFGKLTAASSKHFELTEVFYIQSEVQAEDDDTVDDTTNTTTEQKLIKRGSEVYGPEDVMFIDRDQVMFFENLKSDSEVVQLIKNYKSGSN